MIDTHTYSNILVSKVESVTFTIFYILPLPDNFAMSNIINQPFNPDFKGFRNFLVYQIVGLYSHLV